MIVSALLKDRGVTRAVSAPSGQRPATATAALPATPPRSSTETLRLKIYAALAALDSASLFLAFALANILWLGDPLHAHGIDLFIMVLPLYLGIAMNSRAFAIDALDDLKLSLKRAGRSLLFAIAAIIGVIFYLKVSADFSRMVMTIGGANALILVCGLRWLAGNYFGNRCNWRFTNQLLFVDGVQVYPSRGEAVLFAHEAELRPSIHDPLLLERAGRLLQNCDRVVLACPPERRSAWAAMMKGIDVDVELLAPELDEMGALGIGRYGNRPTVLVNRGPLGMRDRVLKRAFDLVLAASATIALLPLFAVIALAIRLDTPGPVFFRQPRIGLGNRSFRMLKFRSMRGDALDRHARQLTQIGDARVTRTGKFLRKTSLDELPQLINVLLGDMSIVGPRPHAVGALAGDALYWEVDGRYWDRHAVKPGMTGLAQVRGLRGTTFQQSDLTDRLQSDLQYLSGWSIWRDVAIVAATARVLTHRNAF